MFLPLHTLDFLGFGSYNYSNKLERGVELKKLISVFTSDLYLFQKMKLDAPTGVEVILGECESADIVLIDIDTVTKDRDGAITMSRRVPADIKIPFPLGTVARLISGSATSESPLSLSESDKCAFLRGERIRLTEVEYSLLSLLFHKKGEYALREEILDTVWGGTKDAGVVNVYVHYLREKLEAHGEKIIISSRKCGYKIDEKFFGGNDAENN